MLDPLARGISRRVVERPILVALAALVVLGLMASGVSQLELRTGYRGMFHAEDPLLADIEAMHRRYGSGDGLIIMLHARDGDVLSRDGLGAIHHVTEALLALPETRRVTSLSTQRRVARTAIGPVLIDLVPKSLPRSGEALETLRRAALEMPGVAGTLIAASGGAALARASISLPPKDPSALSAFMAKLRDLKREVEASEPNLRLALGGLVVLNSAFVEAAERDMRTLFPAMAGLLCLGLWIFTRSWRGVLGPLAVVIAAVLAALGAAGWLGLPITPILSIAPTIILGIGIADSLHVLMATDRARMAGLAGGPALYRALRRNLTPIYLTTLTTGVGFLSLLFSESPPFRDLGLVTAIGVIAALFFTVTLLPSISLASRGRLKPRYDRMAGWIGWTVDHTQRRRGLALALITVITVVAVTGLARIRSDDRLSEWFDHSVAFRQDLDVIRAAFGPTERTSWVVPLPRGLDDIKIHLLEDLDAFTAWLAARPETAGAVSISSVVSGLTGPGSREVGIAGLRRLAGVQAKPGQNPAASLLAIDNRETRVLVTLASGSTRALRDLEATARTWLESRRPPLNQARPAGPAWSLALLVSSSAESMLIGTAIAFAVIAACLGLILRSWRLGWVGLAAMVLPPALVYGIWSWIGGSVGLAESVVAATSLGLLVDVSIHILTRCSRYRSSLAARRTTVRRAFEAAGPALMVGFLILIAGFAVLTLSPFQGNMHFGLLTAATLAAGIVVAVLVLPFGVKPDVRTPSPSGDHSISTTSGSPPA